MVLALPSKKSTSVIKGFAWAGKSEEIHKSIRRNVSLLQLQSLPVGPVGDENLPCEEANKKFECEECKKEY